MTANRRALFIAVLVATGLSHLAWALLDGRAPWDQGMFFAGLPVPYRALVGEASPLQFLGVLAQPTGWYDAVLALVFWVFGRSSGVLHAVLALQVLGVVGLSGLMAGRVAGARAVPPAAALTASAPLVFAMGRGPWLHLTEALIALAALAALPEPDDGPRRWALAAVPIGALLLLRPSGLVWAAPLIGVLLFRSRGHAKRALAMAGFWLVASVPVLIALPEYLSIKLDARERYAHTLPSVPEESLSMLGPVWMAVVGLGVALFLRRRRRPGAVESVAGAWVLLALGLALFSRSGLFNHTLLAPGLSILAAAGLAGSWRMASLSAAPFALAHGLMWLPAGTPIPGHGAWTAPATPWTWLRPFDGYGEAETHALLDATCPRRRRCMVASDQGLFMPFSEEPGYFELFITGRDEVELLPVRNWREGRAPTPSALAWWSCESAERADGWQQRHPGVAEGLGVLIENRRMRPAWVVPSHDGCAMVWHTPDGTVPFPDRLPDGHAPDSEVGRRTVLGLPGYRSPPTRGPGPAPR